MQGLYRYTSADEKSAIESRIKTALNDSNIVGKDTYTLQELGELCDKSHCDLYWVMMYLRYGSIL